MKEAVDSGIGETESKRAPQDTKNAASSDSCSSSISTADVVKGYLEAIETTSQLPSYDFLSEIIHRHLSRFPFSSVGVRLGADLPLDLGSIYKRIVCARIGGYCFEHNCLLYEVLRELGFSVRLCLARVVLNKKDYRPGLTHRITLVEIGSAAFIVDVGFGAKVPKVPVPVAGQEVSEADLGRVFRVAHFRDRDADAYEMQTLEPDGSWFTMYLFDLTRYGEADCLLGHFYSHKYPKATFVNNLVVARRVDGESRSLVNREYRVYTTIGESTKTVELQSSLELLTLLKDDFEIQLTAEESEHLYSGANPLTHPFKTRTCD